MRPHSFSALFLLSATALFASGCTVAPDSSDPSAPAAPGATSLRGVNIAPDFTFASTRGVGLKLQINVKGVSSAKPFPIEIWNLRKEMLIQAALPKSGIFSTDFPLPLGDHDLVVKVGDVEQLITVGDDNIARATFE